MRVYIHVETRVVSQAPVCIVLINFEGLQLFWPDQPVSELQRLSISTSPTLGLQVHDTMPRLYEFYRSKLSPHTCEESE